jgi:hypothetical protein
MQGNASLPPAQVKAEVKEFEKLYRRDGGN